MLTARLRKMAEIPGLVRSLLAQVIPVVIAVPIDRRTIEKFKSVTTLKRCGVAQRMIVHLTLKQALARTLSSFTIACIPVDLAVRGFPRTVAVLPSETAITFAVMPVDGVRGAEWTRWA